MEYYYLDKTERKGPYTKEEILLRRLSPTTLLLRDDMEEWQHLEAFVELNENVQHQTIHALPESDVISAARGKSKLSGIGILVRYIAIGCV